MQADCFPTEPPGKLKSHYTNINSVFVERDLSLITRYLYGSEVILGTEGREPSIMTKDTHFAVIAQEIPQIWGAVNQEQWMTKYI